MYETVSVEQLFEEELAALKEQHQKLIDENTVDSGLDPVIIREDSTTQQRRKIEN